MPPPEPSELLAGASIGFSSLGLCRLLQAQTDSLASRFSGFEYAQQRQVIVL